jgi:hypothetical protein
MSKNLSINFYAIVKADISKAGHLEGVAGVRVTKNKPNVDANEVPIKMTLEIPMSMFNRPTLETTITIPEHLPGKIDAKVSDKIVEEIRKATGFEVKVTAGLRGDEGIW